MLIAVDVANNEMASFEHPEWHFGYDTDPELGVRTRNLFLDGAAHERVKLHGFQWAYPGVGYAERRVGAFAFRAVDT
ncbi:MAG TPA: hypothetical protein VK434_13790 [Microvirga sp.]|nr:hypothetical protein [Microvirga sp.]